MPGDIFLFRFNQEPRVAMTANDKNEHSHDHDEFIPDSVDDMDEQPDEAGEPLNSINGDSIEGLAQQLEAETRKAQENLELALRTRADMENLRKRTARDIENAHKYALERFVNELLPVMDSLELGIQASESAADITSLREGMNLTLKKFGDSLEKAGVLAINPTGEKFNPDRHSAISMTEVAGTEAGTVITVLQKGYELNGRLVRPAMVVVSK
jgi:molecular chaperone GrpE